MLGGAFLADFAQAVLQRRLPLGNLGGNAKFVASNVATMLLAGFASKFLPMGLGRFMAGAAAASMARGLLPVAVTSGAIAASRAGLAGVDLNTAQLMGYTQPPGLLDYVTTDGIGDYVTDDGSIDYTGN